MIVALLSAHQAAVSSAAEIVPPHGDFAVVDIRRAANVAGGPDDPALNTKIGDTVSFGEQLSWLGGASCEDWSVDLDEEITFILQDNLLSDTQIPPVDGPSTRGDKRVNEGLWLMCAGRPIGEIVRVDDRVVIAETASSMSYVILERPLAPNDILAFQKQLVDMKFLDEVPRDTWTQQSLHAVSSYAQYRGADYRFARAAISENLLDGLRLPMTENQAELVKVVYAGPVAAYFFGPEPGLQMVDRIAFRFDGDDREYPFKPEGDLEPWETQFDIFSPDGSMVLLLQDRFGPYHVVRIENLLDYLAGVKGPDHVVEGRQSGGGVAAVHHDGQWRSNGVVEFRTSCCGDTVVHETAIDLN
jgi:hypothetical protein